MVTIIQTETKQDAKRHALHLKKLQISAKVRQDDEDNRPIMPKKKKDKSQVKKKKTASQKKKRLLLERPLTPRQRTNTEETALILTGMSMGILGDGSLSSCDSFGDEDEDFGEEDDDDDDDSSPTNLMKSNFAKDITLKELRQHFDKPIVDVAKEFGVCITLMKKICRRNGIQRWPHRQIRSLTKSIASMEAALDTVTETEQGRYKAQIDNLMQKRDLVISDPNKDTWTKNYWQELREIAKKFPSVIKDDVVKKQDRVIEEPAAILESKEDSETRGGRWTAEEHNSFLEGIRRHGKNWRKVALVVGTRSAVQTRTHAQKYLLKSQGKLTSAEIDALSNITKENNGVAPSIRSELPPVHSSGEGYKPKTLLPLPPVNGKKRKSTKKISASSKKAQCNSASNPSSSSLGFPSSNGSEGKSSGSQAWLNTLPPNLSQATNLSTQEALKPPIHLPKLMSPILSGPFNPNHGLVQYGSVVRDNAPGHPGPIPSSNPLSVGPRHYLSSHGTSLLSNTPPSDYGNQKYVSGPLRDIRSQLESRENIVKNSADGYMDSRASRTSPLRLPMVESVPIPSLAPENAMSLKSMMHARLFNSSCSSSTHPSSDSITTPFSSSTSNSSSIFGGNRLPLLPTQPPSKILSAAESTMEASPEAAASCKVTTTTPPPHASTLVSSMPSNVLPPSDQDAPRPQLYAFSE